MIDRGKSIAGKMEKIGDLIVYRQKFLDLSWRFEPLHDSLSSPRRLMGLLRSIVQPFMLAMFDTKAHVLARCAVGSELVRDHDAWRSRGLLQQIPQEPLRGAAIPPVLNEDVEIEAILIDGAPEPMFLSGDRDDDLVEMPFVSTNGRAAANAIGEFSTELLGPAPNRFMADDDPARSEYFFDHPQAQWKPKKQPNGA